MNSLPMQITDYPMPYVSISPRSNRLKTAGFSLVEVVIALGIVSFALISLMGLLLVGLTDARESQEKTIASMIERDASARIREVTKYLDTTPLPPVTVANFNHTFFYDDSGNYQGETVTATSRYLATVTVTQMDASNYPINISNTVGQLAAMTVVVAWPLDTTKGTALGNNSVHFVTYLAKNTDQAWATAAQTRP